MPMFKCVLRAAILAFNAAMTISMADLTIQSAKTLIRKGR